MDRALEKLIGEEKCRGVILDLRNNPGGIIEAAVGLCSRFLEDEELVITIEGRDLKKLRKFLLSIAKNTRKSLW